MKTRTNPSQITSPTKPGLACRLVLFVLCALLAALPARAANIVWVSFHPGDQTPSTTAAGIGFTNAPDVGYTSLLRDAGHNVTRVVTMANAAMDTNLLNSADLVIISRSVPSDHYQDPPERAFWHGTVTAPVMILGGYINRTNRLGFMTGNTIPDVNSNPVRLTVLNPSHPIFAGVSLDPSGLMVNGYANIVTHTNFTQRGISVVTDPPAAGGTVLARVGTAGDAAFGGLVVGEWPAGTVISGDTLAGHRLVFLTGSREHAGLNSQGAGIFDLTPDGARMFLNAVNYMTPPASAYPATILSQSPIVYYRFNDPVTAPPAPDPATNAGSLGVAGDGLYINCPTHPVPGALVANPDTAASFDGQSQSVDVPFDASLNQIGAFTVEAWVRPTAFTNFNRAVLASRWVAPGVQQGYQLLALNNGAWRFTTFNGTGGNNLDSPIAPAPLNQWTHVAATHDGSVNRLYVNGALVATSAAVTFVPNTSGGVFRIGGGLSENAGGDFWAGGLDEVAYYSSALSDAEILAHYENGINAAPAQPYEQLVLASTPVGYWRLNDPAGPPCNVAVNSGIRGASANGNYFGGALPGPEAPRGPAFFGFEDTNTAVNLNGSNALVASVSGLLNGMPRFSISGWLRRETDQANRTGLWGQNDIIELGYIDNNTVQAWTDNGLNVAPNPFPNGQWSHLALVSEGSPGPLKMYTNGILAGQRNHVLPATNAFRFNIGGGGVFDAARNFFNGQIDEVAVFDRALTAEEIGAQYFSTIAQAPIITSQPTGTTNIFEGETLTLTVRATGSPPLRYEWLNFGTPVPGQTNATLVITNAQTSDSGSYTVRVTNDQGFVDSSIIEVFVNPSQPPQITQEPVSTTRYVGATARFTVAATGSGNLSYQWQFNTADIPNATNATLVLTNVQPANAGDYRVIVTNAFGTATSAPATLMVLPTPEGSYEAAVMAGNPLAYWRLNETSGTTAFDYAGGFDGTYNGNVTLGVEGAITGDAAAQFDGASGYVGTPLQLNNMPDVTLLGWIRREANQLNRTGLFGQNDLVEFGYINNDTIQAWVDNFQQAVNVTPNPIPNQEWGQVALVLNSGALTVYTNGLPAGTTNLPSASYGSNAFTFNIAGGGIFDTLAANGNWFNGRVDEVTVFGRALTSADVLDLYNAATGGGEMRLNIERSGPNVVLSWTGNGTLQEAPDITGPWQDSANQSNPQNVGTEKFLVYLTPGQEDTNPGTRAGVGNGVISLIASNMLRIDIAFSGMSGTFLADHIHGPAGRGTNAGVMYDLGGLTTVDNGTNGTISGTVTLVEGTQGYSLAQQLDQLRSGLWYVNIHSSTFGGGEIRGQIDPVLFRVGLTAAQEPNTTGNTGEGQGWVALNGTALTVDASFSGLSGNVINSHYHGPAGRGTNASVFYGLVPFTTMGGKSGTIIGTVTLTEGTRGFTVADQLDQLHRGLWYINIHTDTFGGGEIRGQVEKPVMQFFRLRQ